MTDFRISAESGTINLTPVGFHIQGRDFLDAARAYRPIARKNSTVGHFLCCQSIELSLKAFLTMKGLNRDELAGKTFGHNLTKLQQEAKKRDLADFVEITAEEDELLRYATAWYEKGAPIGVDGTQPKTKRLQYATVTDLVVTGQVHPDLDGLDSLAGRLQSQKLHQAILKNA